MSYRSPIDTSRLSPDLQELVDIIINDVMSLATRLASKADSNGGSNPPGVATSRNSVTTVPP